jgi:V8-like Glu-specific endopeptidase
MGMTLRNRFVAMFPASLARRAPVMAVAAAACTAGLAVALAGSGAVAQAGSLAIAPAAVPAARQATAARQVTGVQQVTGGAAQRAAVRYWTTARMTAAAGKQARPRVLLRRVEHRLEHRLVHRQRTVLQAVPAAPWLSGDSGGRGLRWGHGGAVAAAVGKVFFTLGGAQYVCSGVLVGGAHPDVVLTAAHCVTGGTTRDGTTQWAADWVFVPGYRDGRLPYGEYTARRFLVTPDWARTAGGSERDDFAFVQVAAAEPHAAPHGAGGAARAHRGRARPHGLPVAFAGRRDATPAVRAYVFGYPALAPYAGMDATYCAGTAAGTGGSLRTACGMTAGDSGGPWLAGFRPRSGAGTVVAVSTYKLSADPRLLYGTVLGPAARALYLRATAGAAKSRR